MAKRKKESLDNLNPIQIDSITELTAKEPETLEEKSQQIIKKLISENGIEKTQDYTAMFKMNEAKKEMVRINNLGNLGDVALSRLTERVVERPDEITTKELTDIVNMTQTNKERSFKAISEDTETALTQINNNTTEINVTLNKEESLDSEEQERVLDVVQLILNMAKQPQQLNNEIPEPKVVSINKEEGVNNND